MEVWKEVEGFDGYFVSNLGNVKSVDRYINGRSYKGTVLSFKKIRGYNNVGMSIKGKVWTKQVHRLVLIAFNPINDSEQFQVNHINGIKDDNRIENLEWSTPSNNLKHAHRLGLINQRGERNPQSKLTDKDVKDIREKYVELSETKTAEIYNISRALVGMIRRRQVWTHI